MSRREPSEARLEDLPHDRPAAVEVDPPLLLAGGFRAYERYRLTLAHSDGSRQVQQRDVLRGGAVVGVLPYDPTRNVLVLLRQFRLPAHLALGLGEMVEIVAGGQEAGEAPEAAALRECGEEIGLTPRALIPMLRFLPTPGLTDETARLFLGLIDASNVPEQSGAAGESEVTHPFVISLPDALAALAAGRFVNGYLIIALQWLALNAQLVPGLIAGADAREGRPVRAAMPAT